MLPAASKFPPSFSELRTSLYALGGKTTFKSKSESRSHRIQTLTEFANKQAFGFHHFYDSYTNVMHRVLKKCAKQYNNAFSGDAAFRNLWIKCQYAIAARHFNFNITAKQSRDLQQLKTKLISSGILSDKIARRLDGLQPLNDNTDLSLSLIGYCSRYFEFSPTSVNFTIPFASGYQALILTIHDLDEDLQPFIDATRQEMERLAALPCAAIASKAVNMFDEAQTSPLNFLQNFGVLQTHIDDLHNLLMKCDIRDINNIKNTLQNLSRIRQILQDRYFFGKGYRSFSNTILALSKITRKYKPTEKFTVHLIDEKKFVMTPLAVKTLSEIYKSYCKMKNSYNFLIFDRMDKAIHLLNIFAENETVHEQLKHKLGNDWCEYLKQKYVLPVDDVPKEIASTITDDEPATPWQIVTPITTKPYTSR